MVSFTFLATLALAAASFTSAAPIADRRSVSGAGAADSSSNPALYKRAYSGSRATFYDTSVGLGSCGNYNGNSAYTVAMNAAQMNSGMCGKTVWVSYGGKTVTASVQDTCPGCPYGGLDLSEGLFSALASQDLGVIQIEWDFTDAVQQPAPAPTSTWKEPEPTTTWQAPSSTYTPPAPTSTYTPPTSTYTPPTSTYTPPTSTYTPPTTSSTPPPQTSSSSSSSTPSPSSSSSSSSSAAASSSQASLQVSQPFIRPSSTSSAAGSEQTDSASAGTAVKQAQTVSNLQTLSHVLVNYGSFVVTGAGGVVS